MAKTRSANKSSGKENQNPNSVRKCDKKESSKIRQTKNTKKINVNNASQKIMKKKAHPKTKSLQIILQRLSKEEITKLTSEIKQPFKKEYDLRRRNIPVQCDKIKIKNPSKCVAKKDQLIPISTLFNRCKKDSTKQIEINQIVLAKMATYSPWPAKIVQIMNNKAKVFFFGTNQHGQVKVNECVAVEKCGLVISRLIATKQANYHKAVREMEICIGLTGHLRFVLIAS